MKKHVNKHTHSKYAGKIFVCLNCKIRNPRNSYNRHSKFCSSECCGEYQTAKRVAQWLKTGLLHRKLHSNITGGYRTYILKEQHGKCAVCKKSRVWMHLPLVFILDHIDGNASNNARSNLRLLCPNCESQTSTYKARNKGKGRGTLMKKGMQ